MEQRVEVGWGPDRGGTVWAIIRGGDMSQGNVSSGKRGFQVPPTMLRFWGWLPWDWGECRSCLSSVC